MLLIRDVQTSFNVGMTAGSRKAPGAVRDAIIAVLRTHAKPLSVSGIKRQVEETAGPVGHSSVQSYLQLNTPSTFVREGRGLYRLRQDRLGEQIELDARTGTDREPDDAFSSGRSTMLLSDCMDWLAAQNDASVHAIVTDPPYGLVEYSENEQSKLRNGKGGVWRIPPSFDGNRRSPIPRFTTLTEHQLQALDDFFVAWGGHISRVLVPGANVIVASNPLVSFVVANALRRAGLERRGEIVRLVTTMRGGDRPKAAHDEFPGVSVMPRSMWEPWLIFRKPVEGRIQDNLRKWRTGGFRRPETERPFGDVIPSAPTRGRERVIGRHPSLKPQSFLRDVVRAVLPLGEGLVVDPFAGSGSTLAAADAVEYDSIGIEKDSYYFDIARHAIPALASLDINKPSKSSCSEA